MNPFRDNGFIAVFVICLPFATTACSGESAPAADGAISLKGTASDSQPSAGGWRVDEVFLLGRLDGVEPDVFGEIRALEVASNGDLLVFDHFGNELRRFTRGGEFVSAIGGTGSGPGEFRSVTGMAARPNGQVWIVDGRNARYTVINEQGDIGTTIPRAPRVVARPWLGGFDVAGQFFDLAIEPSNAGLTDALLQVSEEGTVISSHPLPRVEIPTPTLGGGVMVPLPFMPVHLRAWDPRGGVWQARSSIYRIVRTDLSGDTTHVVEFDRPGQQFTSTERDSLYSAIRTAEGRFGISIQTEAIPESVPILRWFVADDNGYLWVCASGRDPCSTVDVFDPNGKLHATVELPMTISSPPLPIIRDGRIYGVTSGPQGEPQVFVGKIHQY